MFDIFKILFHQGKQFIPNPTTVEVPGIFRGRPVITSEKINEAELVELCPTNAIASNPVSIDMGKCTFCGECARSFPQKISFTKDYKIYSNTREGLVIKEGENNPMQLDANKIRKEIHKIFKGSLKLRQVSAGGDNSCEWELNASNNVQFDVSRFGIDFVASPRHADGIVITGPITENMAEPLQICYDACPHPKIVILAGTDAISGGIFDGSQALNRSFLDNIHVDLYLAGNPLHPLTFINGILNFIRTKGNA
jgi:Ni,Fe-hydrogenase III small subunit